MNNVTGRIDGLLEYVVDFIRRLKGYSDDIIAFFEDLRDKIEGLLEYVEGKIQSIQSLVGDLKMNNSQEGTVEGAGQTGQTGTGDQTVVAY